MRRWTWIPIVGAGALALAAAVSLPVGAFTWRRGTERAMGALAAPPLQGHDGPPDASASTAAELPAPVSRFFDFALPGPRAPIRSARIRWDGEFQLRPGAGWAPFTAVQAFTTTAPGFVWDAEIRMFPLVPLRVRDSYQRGRASMLGRVGGVFPVVDEGGTPEIAQSALARWLGEAAWFPTALLPGPAVRWEAVDDSTARATIRDGAVSASAEFHFRPDGAIERMTAMRFRDVHGKPVLTPFEGRYGGYALRNGVRVPTTAEVAWLLPEGRFAYWRGRPAEIRYELASGSPAR